MTLLGRGVLVVGENGLDDAVERTQNRGRRGLGACVGLGLGLGQHLADLAPRVPEHAGDLANAHAVAVRAANLAMIVHRQHPCLRCLSPRGEGDYWNGCGWGGSILLADLGPTGGSLLRAENQRRRWSP